MVKPAGKQDTGATALEAAEALFTERGYAVVSLREVAPKAGIAVSSISYHYDDKTGLLPAIYERHTRPMNARRLEHLGEARRTPSRPERSTAILRAYLLPAFSFSSALL